MSAAVPIRLPHTIGGRAISHILKHFLSDYPQGPPAEIEMSFDKVHEIEPEGVTFLSNTFLWLLERGSETRLVDIHRHRTAIRHLESARFFEQHSGKSIGASADRIGWTLPLFPVGTSSSHAWVDRQLAPWLIERTDLFADALYPLQASILELFHNITEHAQLEIGSTYVQIVEDNGDLLIQISIADYGAGIPDTLRKVAPCKTDDYDAIVEATKYGVSSKGKDKPGGAGLDQLMRSVVLQAGGVITIFSARGIARFCNKNHGIFPERPYSDVGFAQVRLLAYPFPLKVLGPTVKSVKQLYGNRSNQSNRQSSVCGGWRGSSRCYFVGTVFT